MSKQDTIVNLPFNEGISLYSYQQDALDWIKAKEGPCSEGQHYGMKGIMLALEMGLGKTMIGLSHLLSRIIENKPHLVVVSKTLLYEWRNQIQKLFLPNSVRVLYFHSELFPAMKTISLGQVRKDYDIVITTYDVAFQTAKRCGMLDVVCEYGDEHSLQKGKVVAINLRNPNSVQENDQVRGPRLLYSIVWNSIICDESQKFRNPDTGVYKAMMALACSGIKMCMTGTAIQNNNVDLWSQLRWLGYNGVTTSRAWKRIGDDEYFRHKLDQYVYRKKCLEVGITLPECTTYRHMIRMKKNQEIVYRKCLGELRDAYQDSLQLKVNYMCVLAIFLRLRQTCIAPFLVSKKQLNKKRDPYLIEALNRVQNEEITKDWVKQRWGTAGVLASKMNVAVSIVRKMPTDQKVIIFSTFVACLELAEDALINSGIPRTAISLVDGQVKGQERTDIIAHFKTDPQQKVLLMNYKVGSEGLNITEATYVICMEPWWNEATHKQAIARIHRIGQENPITVHYLIMEQSIELLIFKLCFYKEEISGFYLDGQKAPTGGRPGPNKAELGMMLQEMEKKTGEYITYEEPQIREENA